jgi:hypothetical protein
VFVFFDSKSWLDFTGSKERARLGLDQFLYAFFSSDQVSYLVVSPGCGS